MALTAREVYDELRQQILGGALPAGRTLVENSVAEQLDVSRTPVREALRRLEQDGLVERAGRGMRVVQRSPEQILEIYEVRVILEAAAARMAADRRTDFDIRRLRAIHEQMRQLATDDAAERVRLNNAFHEALWQASHNGTLVDFITRLLLQLRPYPQTTLTAPGRWELIVEEHQELITAIEDRRTADAAEIATGHMTQARDIRLRMFADEFGASTAPA